MAHRYSLGKGYHAWDDDVDTGGSSQKECSLVIGMG